MSLGGGTKKPKIVKQEPIEEVQQVKEDETAAVKRERRKRILSEGRTSTVISGIDTKLKQRLGQ
jgi:hypothetical protein